MILTKIIIAGKVDTPVKLSNINTFFILHLDIFTNQNVLRINETKRGFVVNCKVPITKKKLKALRALIKQYIDCFKVSFVTDEK